MPTSNKFFALFFGAFLLAAPAYAVKTGEPMVFSRADVEITHAPTADKQTSSRFSVEIRTDTANINPDWFRLSGYEKARGLMVWYPRPEQVTISPINEYAPKDVLFLDNYGTIIQLAPKLVLAEMEENITPEEPVQAVLYLHGGICEAMNIKPGDKVRYQQFQKKPFVIKQGDAPAETPAETAPPPATNHNVPKTETPKTNINSKSELSPQAGENKDLVDQILKQNRAE